MYGILQFYEKQTNKKSKQKKKKKESPATNWSPLLQICIIQCHFPTWSPPGLPLPLRMICKPFTWPAKWNSSLGLCILGPVYLGKLFIHHLCSTSSCYLPSSHLIVFSSNASGSFWPRYLPLALHSACTAFLQTPLWSLPTHHSDLSSSAIFREASAAHPG